jgi:hypothetical protein
MDDQELKDEIRKAVRRYSDGIRQGDMGSRLSYEDGLVDWAFTQVRKACGDPMFGASILQTALKQVGNERDEAMKKLAPLEMELEQAEDAATAAVFELERVKKNLVEAEKGNDRLDQMEEAVRKNDERLKEATRKHEEQPAPNEKEEEVIEKEWDFRPYFLTFAIGIICGLLFAYFVVGTA